MSISYELAKELKESGFPQHKCRDLVDGESICGLCEQGTSPTLEELIEACGDKFGCLEFFNDFREENKWIARLPKNFFDNGFLGKTPIEAVVRLYIALHKQ